MLFDTFDRSDRTKAALNESIYSFLNRTATSYFSKVRDLLEEWMAGYDRDHVSELEASMRTENDFQFTSGYWELFLYTAFKRSGYSIEVHPKVSESKRRPDFLMKSDDNAFILEAVSVGRDPKVAGRQRRFADALEPMHLALADNFQIGLTTITVGEATLSSRRMLEDIRKWLNSLDVDELLSAQDSSSGPDRFPTRRFEQGDWKLWVQAIALPPEYRGAGRSLVLMWGPDEASALNNAEVIRMALRKKANRYGRLEHPLVVAVLSNTEYLTRLYEVEESLYGSAYVRPLETISSPQKLTTDGHWITKRGWRRSHIPNVIVGINLHTWNLAQVEIGLWRTHQPEVATLKLPSWLSEVDISGTQASMIPGSPLWELFGLDAKWPGPEADFEI